MPKRKVIACKILSFAAQNLFVYVNSIEQRGLSPPTENLPDVNQTRDAQKDKWEFTEKLEGMWSKNKSEFLDRRLF